MKNTLVKHTKTQATQCMRHFAAALRHIGLWRSEGETHKDRHKHTSICFSKLTLVWWRPQLFFRLFLVDLMVLKGFPDGSGYAVEWPGCVVWGNYSGLSPQAVARYWVPVRELDTSPDSCCVLLSRFEVLGCMTSFQSLSIDVEERVMPSILFS